MQKTKLRSTHRLKIETKINVIVERLFKIMRSHIGMNNAIERDKLFYQVYKIREEMLNELQYIALWDILKKSMHKCRQRTKCFITNFRVYNEYKYFVVRDIRDANCYSKIVTSSIKALESMEKRCYKSVKEGWHRLEWVI